MPTSVYDNGGFIGISRNIYGTLSYVGGVVHNNAGTTSNITKSLTPLTGGIASAPEEDDLVIIVASIGSTANRSYRISGYTQIVDLYSDDTYDTNLQVGYKFMSSTPDTTFTITGGTGSTNDAIAIAVHVWRNVDKTTPLDVTSTTNTQQNTGLPNPPAITPITKNSQILVAAGTALASPGSLVYTTTYLNNFLTEEGTDTNDCIVGLGSILWSEGSYDPATWTMAPGDSTSYSCASVTMALRPSQVKTKGVFNLNNVFDNLS